ncbi:MAG: Haloacid dehalogenase domain protein hydrolase [Burkholderiaceae bacterium]|nr:Haloacid dehalogenase domain protein hydrolase [Burkholderiaceae bacterium]
MMTPDEIVFLFDVDNTLLDNDRVTADLKKHLAREFGAEDASRYWHIFESLRAELGYADYLGALQRYRMSDMSDPGMLMMSSFLLEYPFANRLYPQSLDVLEHVQQWGNAVILSDGDVVFQPRKVQRSGLWEEVDGRVLIFVHKEDMLDVLMERYPARHYVMIDDKLRILAAMKARMGAMLTTVFPRQGHYAHDPKNLEMYPPADITVERIGDLLELGLDAFLPAGQ